MDLSGYDISDIVLSASRLTLERPLQVVIFILPLRYVYMSKVQFNLEAMPVMYLLRVELDCQVLAC